MGNKSFSGMADASALPVSSLSTETTYDKEGQITCRPSTVALLLTTSPALFFYAGCSEASPFDHGNEDSEQLKGIVRPGDFSHPPGLPLSRFVAPFRESRPANPRTRNDGHHYRGLGLSGGSVNAFETTRVQIRRQRRPGCGDAAGVRQALGSPRTPCEGEFERPSASWGSLSLQPRTSMKISAGRSDGS